MSLFSPGGNERLERILSDSEFDVARVSREEDILPGIVILDMTSPELAQRYLEGSWRGPRELRSRGLVVLAALSSDTFTVERVAEHVASAHSFFLADDPPGSVRATILASLHRKELDDALKNSEARYRLLAENAGDVIWTWDLRKRTYDFISPSILRLRGLTVEEALAESMEQSMSPDSYRNAMANLEAGTASLARGVRPAPMTDYYDQPCKDGSVKTVEITTSVIYDETGAPTHVLGVSRDATERVRDKASLESSLRNRELLFRELEHRVKNTLAMIASLLSLASGHVRDPADAILFEESQSRIQALALVYDKLLKSPDVARIDLGSYLEDLCRAVASAFSRGEGRVELRVDRDEITVDSKRAALVGLAVNELVTNSLKYAARPGCVLALSLSVHSSEGVLTVRFADDGPGLPAGFSGEDAEGLGFLLIRSLSSQLGGEFRVEAPASGASFRLDIPYPADGPSVGRPV